MYALVDGELVVLKIKGAALGSKTRDKKYPNFYDYLQTLGGGIFTHVTTIGGVKEDGAKTFYTSTFNLGRETTDEEKMLVLEKLEELDPIFKEYDEAQKGLLPNEDEEKEEDEDVPFSEEKEDEEDF
jgi:hypothetical protein